MRYAGITDPLRFRNVVRDHMLVWRIDLEKALWGHHNSPQARGPVVVIRIAEGRQRNPRQPGRRRQAAGLENAEGTTPATVDH